MLNPDGPTSIPEFPGLPKSVLENVIVLPFNDLERCQNLIRYHKEELACVILEAVVSSFGYIPADSKFLQGIRDITNDLEILLVFDEVQSFRISPGGAQEHLGVSLEVDSLLGHSVDAGILWNSSPRLVRTTFLTQVPSMQTQ